ncbi:pilus assembly FimT family protein [Massilia oculi]|uniref:pilus assembly FimT family protein n=1 Tax=Massilia oculi TaxID=945844 RepID=UPI001AAE2844
MHPVTARACGLPRRQSGFTALEAMIAVSILGILMAVGIPRLSGWLAATKAAGAGQFYVEGFALARTQALAHNSNSRLVFIDNPGGQPDWRVDICFRATGNACDDASNDWSTPTTAANAAPGESAAFRSIRRSAAGLPPPSLLAVTLGPDDEADAVYFTPTGWVDGGIAPRVTQIDLTPAEGKENEFRPSAVMLTLAGIATTCDPDVDAGDSRRCPQ